MFLYFWPETSFNKRLCSGISPTQIEPTEPTVSGAHRVSGWAALPTQASVCSASLPRVSPPTAPRAREQNQNPGEVVWESHWSVRESLPNLCRTSHTDHLCSAVEKWSGSFLSTHGWVLLDRFCSDASRNPQSWSFCWILLLGTSGRVYSWVYCSVPSVSRLHPPRFLRTTEEWMAPPSCCRTHRCWMGVTPPAAPSAPSARLHQSARPILSPGTQLGLMWCHDKVFICQIINLSWH